jgi:hypothetical protein
MKQFYLLFSFLLVLASGIAQNNIVSYAYDNAGNRISRKIVDLNITPNPSHVKKNADPVPVEDQLGERKITVYPNPTKGALAVEITGGDTKDQIRLIVFSSQGTQLQNIKVTATTTPVDMSAYPGGWYILRVQAGDKVTEFKIVKQ